MEVLRLSKGPLLLGFGQLWEKNLVGQLGADWGLVLVEFLLGRMGYWDWGLRGEGVELWGLAGGGVGLSLGYRCF